MYQRLPYHGHCCSTRDDIGLTTQPFSAEGALAPPPGSHWMKSWSISAGLSRPSSPVSFHGMPLQVWMVRPWMFAAIEFWNAKPTNWTL